MRTFFRKVAFRIFRCIVRVAQNLPFGADRFPAALAAWRIASRTRVIVEVPGASRVAVFDAFRFRHDVDLIGAERRLTLLELPVADLQAVSALFSTRPPLETHEAYYYFLETDERCWAEREKLADFVQKVCRSLAHRLSLDAAISPGVFYEYEIPWSAGFRDIGKQFVAVHKEFTVMGPENMQERIKRFAQQRRKFHGTGVYVVNELAARLFTESGIAQTDQVKVVGLPRMDALFQRFDTRNPDCQPVSEKKEGKQITMFSFAHYGGDLEPGERRSKLFSKYDHEGFVRLFNEVHGMMGRLALNFPDAKFVIKPKNVVDWWTTEIDAAIVAATGRHVGEIPNLSVEDRPPHDLLAESDAVIGFNSTVLLESKIARKTTILPLFAEATDRYPDNVYLKENADIFICPNSAEAMESVLRQVLLGEAVAEPASQKRVSEVLNFYLGYSDGNCTRRFIDEFCAAIG